MTLRKCNYSLGFEHVPLDQSRESLTDNTGDESYSNKYGSREQQQGAWEDYEVPDELPEDGLRSAIGSVTSARVELLVGLKHDHHIKESVHCEPGNNAVTVRFKVAEQEDIDSFEELENKIMTDNTEPEPCHNHELKHN